MRRLIEWVEEVWSATPHWSGGKVPLFLVKVVSVAVTVPIPILLGKLCLWFGVPFVGFYETRRIAMAALTVSDVLGALSIAVTAAIVFFTFAMTAFKWLGGLRQWAVVSMVGVSVMLMAAGSLARPLTSILFPWWKYDVWVVGVGGTVEQIAYSLVLLVLTIKISRQILDSCSQQAVEARRRSHG